MKKLNDTLIASKSKNSIIAMQNIYHKENIVEEWESVEKNYIGRVGAVDDNVVFCTRIKEKKKTTTKHSSY